MRSVALGSSAILPQRPQAAEITSSGQPSPLTVPMLLSSCYCLCVPNLSKEDWKKYILEVELPNYPSPMKMLKGMSRQEIEEYMGDLTSAKHLLVAVTELPDFVEYAAGIALKGDREDLWYLYDKMQELGYQLLTSGQFHDIVHNEDVSLSAIVEKIVEVATSDLGVSGFDKWYNTVSSI
jgi:hypothetical protein